MTSCAHEAGHLCASLAERLTPNRQLARIHDNGAWGSVAQYDGEGRRLSEPGAVIEVDMDPGAPEAGAYLRRRALAWASMFLSGYAAEALLHDYADQVIGWPAPLLGNPDLANATAFLSLGWPRDIAGPLWCAWRQALHLLSREWSWVLRVAGEIEHAGECSSELATVLRGKRRASPVAEAATPITFN